MIDRSSSLRALSGAAALAALAALAACADQPTAVRPLPSSPSRVVSASQDGGTYLVLDRGNGFNADFAARVAALGGTVSSVHAGAGLAVVSGLSATAAAQLTGGSDVSDVQADAEFTLDAPVAAVQADMSGVADPVATSQSNPASAILASWQWNMRAIKANVAWAAGKLGSSGVTVAILDSGIDYDALDLNGLVDLSRSTSFVPRDDSLRAARFPSRHVVTDFNGHGTNVATQVSSKAVALAGVTSKTTLIGVKVLGRTGSGSTGGVLNGVLWAADHGADVANMSLGSEFAKAGNGRLLSTIQRVFNYAGRKGMLIVVAAGNEAADLDHNGNVMNAYCNASHVVCVSAVGPTAGSQLGTSAQDAPTFYTNFGRSAIEVAAPGGNAQVDEKGNPNLVSAWPWGNDVASWVWSLCSKTYVPSISASGVPSTPCAAGNRLTGEIGTSQASPHVAGLAALIVAESGRGQPSQVKAALLRSADDLGQPGVDPFYGSGRINVARAVGLQ
jgi:subtilisin family serine protease